MAVMCVRNTVLEDLHAGAHPASESGDYMDVKVVSPFGEIPWTKLSRICDDEMRRLMKEVVTKLYSGLLRLDDPQFVERMKTLARQYAWRWDEPKDVLKPSPRRRKNP